MSVEFWGWFAGRPLRLTWGAPPYGKLSAGLNVGKVVEMNFRKNISNLRKSPAAVDKLRQSLPLVRR
jgi:hypothetical protein